MKTIGEYKVLSVGACDGHHAVVEILIGRKHRQGLVDLKGNFRVEPIYQSIDLLSDCWYACGMARTPSQKYDLVSLQPRDLSITNGAEGQYITRQGRKQGVDDAHGHEIIAHKYRNMWYRGGCYVVRDYRGRIGAFDSGGRMIIPCDKYYSISPIRTPELRFIVSTAKNYFGEGAFRILLADGRPQSTNTYYWICYYLGRGNKLKFIKHFNGGFGIMMPDETAVIPPVYDILWPLGERYVRLSTDDMEYVEGLVDYNNHLVLPPVYTDIYQGVGEQLILSKEDDEDYPMSWTVVVKLVPNEAYKQTLAQENCRRLIDALDLTLVGVEPKCVPREIIPPHYRHISAQGAHYRVLSAELRYGMLSPSGEVLIPCEYDSMEYSSDDYIAVRLGDDNFYINIRNERVLF